MTTDRPQSLRTDDFSVLSTSEEIVVRSLGDHERVRFDDGENLLSIEGVDTMTDEEVRDVVGTLVTSGANTTVTYDDATDTLTVDLPDNISVPTVDTGELSGVQFASSPDDLQRAVDALPNGVGTVILEPGDYGDSDWTTGVTLPTELSRGTLTIHGSGSRVDLSSWDGSTFFEKAPETANADAGRVIIRDLYVDCYNVASSDLTKFVDVADVGHSHFEYTAIGEFDVGTHIWSSGDAGSSHHNSTNILHNRADIGLKLGKTSATLGVDRGSYRAQVGGIGDAGCEVAYGGWNELYIQPERARDDVANGAVDGVRTLPPSSGGHGHDNRVRIIHRLTQSDEAVPARLEGKRNRIDAVGLGSNRVVDKLAGIIPPTDIRVQGWQSQGGNSFGEMVALNDTSSTGNATSPAPNGWGQVLFNAGSTSGDISALQTLGGLTTDRSAEAYLRATNINGSGSLKVGFYHDASNYLAFEVNPADSTVYADHVSGGSSASGFPIDTGADPTTLNDYALFCGSDDNGNGRQFWAINGEVVAETAISQGNYPDNGILPARAWAESDGTNTRYGAKRFEVGQRDNNVTEL